MNNQNSGFPLKRPLHILYLARWYPHKFDSIYGLFVKRHAEAAATKHQVSVFYMHPCDELETKKKVEIKKGFINEYYYYFRKSKTGIRPLDAILNIWKYVKGYRTLRRKIPKPNLIHVHVLTRLGVIAYFVNKWSNIPYVITEHWSRYQEGNWGYEGFIRKYFTRLAVSNAKVVTTVTDNLKRAMENHNLKNSNYRILSNVVDTKVFFPENRAGRNTELKKLVHVSCFDDEPKNITGLLDCIKELSTRRNDFKVEMIGLGKDFDRIVKKAEVLGLLDTCVYFMGQMEGRQLGDHVRTADVLMLFSNYENMPVVINEAFCCGIPVISTNVGGIGEFVNESNGALVRKNNIIEFVDTLDHMLNNLDKYDQKAISQQAVSQFSLMAISNQLDEIYTQNTYS